MSQTNIADRRRYWRQLLPPEICLLTGLLSGLGHVLRTTWSYMSGLLGDYLLRTNRMSRTNVRKLATAGCELSLVKFQQ
ncbi:hypothetical protein GEV33_014465 [Tenebrio molitor]|uniref:Uncharacterized protein n=1 Tax=Tenebrio molitor TaxID=7067 RepID=A0A8J6LCN8_TENMO|nr:hypothetical protein GEV33_014465 [Tenebrio molitor]